MNLSEGRLAPVPGSDGLVTRTPGAVLFVAGRTPVHEVRRITEIVTGARGDAPARPLARELASLVAGDEDGSLPGFAVVAASPGGTYVRVYGAVEVHLHGDDGQEMLTGVGSFTGVDRELAGTFHTIAVQPAGQPVPAPVFDVDVQAGTAPGNGFSITTMTSPTDAPVEVPPSTEASGAPAPAPPEEPGADSGPGSGSGEADAVAAMHVVGGSAPAPGSEPEADVVTPGPDAAVDAPTQAWTPSTADFEADDIAAAPADEPAWGSVAPDAAPSEAPVAEGVPLDTGADAPAPEAPTTVQPPQAPPSLGKAPAAEAPGTPTPPPDLPSTSAAPSSAPAEPVPFEALPVADPAPAPPPHEPATTALPVAPPADEAPAAPEPPAAAAPAGGFTSQLLGALDEDEPDEREPLPVELDPGEVRQPDAQITAEVQVQGVICSRGHFNDPRSRFCSSCGISMVQNTQILTNGPRPPLGVMVFEDGATFSLSSDYVVGRQPDVSELVQQGLALPLPVDDPERSISRAHAELRLVDWDVHLVNLSGTNGSFVWDENGQQWVPIPEGQSVVLTPGMRVALGRRSAVFESSLVR
ncbi:FHA domain-containing protein [Iamia sp. SCSIO 61187]|uniref:FHA domain-containing protein n=1 Tax=Iamia sp. SCSIO 61187 TaxID=2722752 RepID=UPI001C632478|nr:FHA domain-containing protein [Iamia sp. SCSIO 61187]QYG94542.1 FHA domain-containing protein [Iamia sp. SCSIO 61187]